MEITLEDRILQLENKVEKQSFQIRLLRRLATDGNLFGLIDLILKYDLSESEFYELRNLTLLYEKRLANNMFINKEEYIEDFLIILKSNGLLQNKDWLEIESFIKLWLKGPEGGIGISKVLYDQFY